MTAPSPLLPNPLLPSSEAEVCAVIQASSAPLSITGGGTRRIGDIAGARLSTAALTGVTLYEPAALTLVLRAGTSLDDVTALLTSEGQRLGFEPPEMGALLGRAGVSTIGGVVATNAAGPRGVQLGTARDSVLGLRFVDGRGAAISSGGRVMKNVTGYDLVKLLVGSHGRLGVLTEVSLKVQSIPEAEATLRFDGIDLAGGLTLLRRALAMPFDVTGAARAGGASYLRIEGMAGSVAYRAGKLGQLGATDVRQGAASAAIWQGLRDGAALVGRAGDLWRIHTLPSHAADIISGLMDPLGANPETDAIFDHGGAKIWALLPAGAQMQVQSALAGNKGQAVKLRGAGAAPFAAQSAEVAALQTALLAQFDPLGRFGSGPV